MKIRRMLVNEYTVGGSLLLIGAGFFSTRFTEALGYKLFSIPSMIPVIGGMDMTVGRVAALVPLSLGTAFLLRTVRPVTDRIPIVDKVADIADEIVSEVSKPVASEVKGAEFCASCSDKEMEAETVDHLNRPKSPLIPKVLKPKNLKFWLLKAVRKWLGRMRSLPHARNWESPVSLLSRKELLSISEPSNSLLEVLSRLFGAKTSNPEPSVAESLIPR